MRNFLGLVLLGTIGLSMSCSETAPTPVQLPGDLSQLEAWIDDSEGAVGTLTPGTEKRIVWHRQRAEKTPLSVVYLHGFSATRQEVAPLAERLAVALGANLFETRLAGHGLPGEALAEVEVSDWLRDTEQAIRIGELLGERTIVVSVSTGSTLSTWAATQPFADQLAAMVMISPNFELPDPGVYRIDWPLGLGVVLAEWLVGEERSWEPINDDHGKYWTTRYPTRAARPLIRLLKQVRQIDKSQIKVPTLMVYSPNDKVVSVPAILQTFRQFDNSANQLSTFDQADDPYQHVLAGRILAPSGTQPMFDLVSNYLFGLKLIPSVDG